MHLSNDKQQDPDFVLGAAGGHQMTKSQEAPRAESSIPTHPLGVKPLGNKYFSSGDDARNSLKGHLGVLPDEMLMQLLEFLDQRTLKILGYTCRFLFAACMSDDLWKSIFLK